MIENGHGRRIAILIGTNEYSKMDKLEFAENDAREMGKVLLDPDVCGFDEVIELIDKGKEEVSHTIEKVFKNVKQDDEVLIYYSGHGKPSYKFDLCLLFKDSDPESLLATSLKFDYINECKEQSVCKRLVIILDCCYSGTAGMRGNYLEEMLSSYSGSGTVLLTSTGETGSNIAKEDRELKHGVFTSYLLKGLKDWAADDDDNGIITVDDLYKYTFNETKAKGLQRPQKKGSYEGEMILGRNIPKIKHKELGEKNEKLMKHLSSAPPDVLYRSLTILQKMYEDSSALDPMEVNIKPHLESLIDGKIEVENYIKIVRYQEKIQTQKGEEKKLEEIQGKEKEEQDKLKKQAEEEQQKEEREKKERVTLEAKKVEEQREKEEMEKKEREEKEREALEVKKAEEREEKAREEEKKARREQEEQEKLRKQREEAERKKLEEAKKAQVPPLPSKKPKDSSGKRLVFLTILLILIAALIYILYNDNFTFDGAELKVDPEPSFELELIKGESESKEFVISNEGEGTLEWTVSADQEWIILSPENGTNSETVTVMIDTDNLDPGTYEGTISINSNDGSKEGNVQLNVLPPSDVSETSDGEPVLAVNPEPSFELELIKGESESKEFVISNEGAGTLEWTVSADQEWIILSPENGTNSETVTVMIDTDNLDPGTYKGTISINSNDGSKEGNVQLNVLPIEKELKVDPEPSFELELIKGESESKEFVISNEGEGTLEWTVSADQEWIILSPENGTNSETVTVMIDTDNLDPGTYEGTISINSNDGSKEGNVQLNVLPPSDVSETSDGEPVLAVNPEPSFEFKLIKGESESKEFVISNEGAGTLEWTVSADQEWIILNPDGGTNPETVTVMIDTDDLDPGTYEGIITINSSGGTKQGIITLEVLAPPSEV